MDNAVIASRWIESGFVFEKHFAEEARRRGLLAYRVRNKTARYDLVVQGLKVQCKSKNTLNSKMTIASKKPYIFGDFDILAVNFCGKVLIVPASQLKSQGDLILTEINPFYFARFEDNWSVFDGLIATKIAEPEQLTLFDSDK